MILLRRYKNRYKFKNDSRLTKFYEDLGIRGSMMAKVFVPHVRFVGWEAWYPSDDIPHAQQENASVTSKNENAHEKTSTVRLSSTIEKHEKSATVPH